MKPKRALTLLLLMFVIASAVHIHDKYGIKNYLHTAMQQIDYRSAVQGFINRATTTAGSADTKIDRKVLHASMHSIIAKTKFGGGGCSATAIGAHALLTASHCEEPSDKLYMDMNIDKAFGKDAVSNAKIEKVLRDDNEHSIYLVSGVTFKYIANVDESNSMEPGQRVFMYGNPRFIRDQYREGYFTGFEDIESKDGIPCHCLLFDMNTSGGDSGSGMFDMNGNLVAVLSYGNPANLTGTFPLRFTEAQLKEAKNF
jgi:trypsin-like peptidase